jgi:hypothetical protein
MCDPHRRRPHVQLPASSPWTRRPPPSSGAPAWRPTTRTPRTPRSGDSAPCRVCLDRFEPGAERRLLFTHDPFRDTVDLPLPGPVFVHEAGCRRYAPDAGFPPSLCDAPLTFNAYGADRALLARERTQAAAEADAAIDRLLGAPGVEYVHVRSTRAGCFLCRLDPVPAAA